MQGKRSLPSGIINIIGKNLPGVKQEVDEKMQKSCDYQFPGRVFLYKNGGIALGFGLQVISGRFAVPI